MTLLDEVQSVLKEIEEKEYKIKSLQNSLQKNEQLKENCKRYVKAYCLTNRTLRDQPTNNIEVTVCFTYSDGEHIGISWVDDHQQIGFSDTITATLSIVCVESSLLVFEQSQKALFDKMNTESLDKNKEKRRQMYENLKKEFGE